MSQPEISVIIVSWNVKELLEKCLLSLQQTNQTTSFEVIVVDNASNDGSARMVKEKFPDIRLVANTENQGFAQACHQGVKNAQGQFFLFLNDDTEVGEESLQTSVLCFRSNPNTAVVGCKILNPDRSLQLSVRQFPSVYSLVITLLKLHNFFPRLLQSYLQTGFDYTKPAEVEQVMGAFFLTSRQLWRELGGFDTGYYIWFEEVDYCRRAIEQGYLVRYCPETSIVHHRGASFQKLKALREQIIFNQSARRYARLHFSIGGYALVLACLPVSWLLAAGVTLLDFLHINPKHLL